MDGLTRLLTNEQSSFLERMMDECGAGFPEVLCRLMLAVDPALAVAVAAALEQRMLQQ